MSNYKEFEKCYIGTSDIAALTVRSVLVLDTIHFKSDGSYSAYIVDSETEIPKHYDLVFLTENPWLWIYDDNGKTLSLKNPGGFHIYRAGNYGCIIKKL